MQTVECIFGSDRFKTIDRDPQNMAVEDRRTTNPRFWGGQQRLQGSVPAKHAITKSQQNHF